MSALSPDALIAPWLSERKPKSLWVVGQGTPPVIQDFATANDTALTEIRANMLTDLSLPVPMAAICVDPILGELELEHVGILRNRLITDIFCLVSQQIPAEALYALGFHRGEYCVSQAGELLSFHYALATYNHTRAWNNPKFWANPENWNKYWW